ncbi:MAG: glycoside hydrolase family 25 protein [Oscillospiraceae bacterium]|nr:glycoside hydrolase family 25 protein [Oscillospiraceae bacterium]
MPDNFENDIFDEIEQVFEKEDRHTRIIVILCVVLVIAIVVAIIFGISYYKEHNKVIYTSAEIATLEEENEAIIKAKERSPVPVSDNRFYFKDGLLGEAWLPVIEGVEKNTLDGMSFETDDKGRIYYAENGEKLTKFGIDVSAHQHDIDWEKVKADGVEFVMIRIGNRGYETGNISFDKKFRDNIRGAKEAGLPVGVYFFSQAVSLEEAVEEAEFVLEMLDGEELTYPVVYDWEIIGTDPARTDTVSAETVNDCAVVFCEMMKNEGYKPMVYMSRRMGYFKFDLSRLNEYDIWLAEYGDVPTMFYQFDMWQYSCTGTIDGIEGDVDMNICFKDYTSEEE